MCKSIGWMLSALRVFTFQTSLDSCSITGRVEERLNRCADAWLHKGQRLRIARQIICHHIRSCIIMALRNRKSVSLQYISDWQVLITLIIQKFGFTCHKGLFGVVRRLRGVLYTSEWSCVLLTFRKLYYTNILFGTESNGLEDQTLTQSLWEITSLWWKNVGSFQVCRNRFIFQCQMSI